MLGFLNQFDTTDTNFCFCFLQTCLVLCNLLLNLLINRVHPVSSNARLIQRALRQVFQGQSGVRVLDTDVPAIEAYPRAATRGLPVHRVEYRQPAGRTAPAALETMRTLAGELFPVWRERFALVTGRADAGGAGHGERA